MKVVNYRCDDTECPKDYNILHVKATEIGKNDTVHYLWSAIGLPAIIVAHNYHPDTKLHIDWKNGSQTDMQIKFVPEIIGISGFVFKDLTEYNDVNDDQTPFGHMLKDLLQSTTWDLSSCKNLSDGASASFKGSLEGSNSSSIMLDVSISKIRHRDGLVVRSLNLLLNTFSQG